MKNLKLTILAAVMLGVLTTVSVAQPPTTAKTFRMYNDATHTVSLTAGTGLGTGTFTWMQPAVGIFHSDASGNMSLSPVDLTGGDVTGILNISRGGTGNSSVGGAGSVAFSDGTKINYTAVGTTNQFLISGGTGAPTWTNTMPAGTNVPFNLITTGTNTQAAMTVGTGASISPTGSGTVTANQFVGSGSTTNAVDLGTAEINGTLGVSNGGTGNTVVGSAGTVAFSDGTKINYTAVGAAGQTLQSNGSSTPTWVNLPGQLVAKGRVAGDNTNFSYTITPGIAIPAGASITVSLESATNAAITVTARTGTTFTVQAPIILSTSDFINYLIF
ncbi:MAG: hypothetical protein ABI778_04815 [Ignavibacteriota bacterium]